MVSDEAIIIFEACKNWTVSLHHTYVIATETPSIDSANKAGIGSIFTSIWT